MDVMELRRMMFTFMLCGGFKQTIITLAQNHTNVNSVLTEIVSLLPSFDIIYIIKDRDYSVVPTIENEFISASGVRNAGVDIINNKFQNAIRYKNGTYASTSTGANYDGIASVGDKFIVFYRTAQ